VVAQHLVQPFCSQKDWQQDVPPHTRTSSPSSSTVVTSQARRSGHSAGIGVHSPVIATCGAARDP
jgi:hypothetical protein